ncbi:hypothetical protein RB3683 [Rhodopirellula baltica SH 1]|uniref:Uncharacterized protein n=1 Tax=Rhodopirellula baltica (strain DSM 10527 / NCIMB 13988 / SH1) TaxID=243090 RepID=Q7UTU0_RHOBA|nr:hypothetical protein RB3683 [Rhodopirellula baltica SH 1]
MARGHVLKTSAASWAGLSVLWRGKELRTRFGGLRRISHVIR